MSLYQSKREGGTPYNDYVQPSAGGKPQHLGKHHMGQAEAVRRGQDQCGLQRIPRL